jgi:SAM-dependent methyltransferase
MSQASTSTQQYGANDEYLRLLVCPYCHGSLDWSETIRCEECGRCFPLISGHPTFVVSDDRDESEHDHGSHKRKQAAYFDRKEADEFEINRPRGAPRLYGWLLGEKIRRSLAGLKFIGPGSTALTVCAGSGMDAEFLARQGFTVIAADISSKAVQRTAERARRVGLTIFPIVADIERLPFRSAAIDLVYVHDGLHHLEEPLVGLSEMARVGRSVSITEPARAAATAVAVRLGASQDLEPAGNRVHRFTLAELGRELDRKGFRVVHAERYAMYYRHQPGRVFGGLSAPLIFPVAKAAQLLFNSLAGRWGNKLTVQAVRRESSDPPRTRRV